MSFNIFIINQVRVFDSQFGNDFLKEQLAKLPVGKILFPAEGEGRNAVYGSKLGWDIAAFDISSEGRNKAITLAENNKVSSIDYQVGELQTLDFKANEFDVIALIYAHFPAEINRHTTHYSTAIRVRAYSIWCRKSKTA